MYIKMGLRLLPGLYIRLSHVTGYPARSRDRSCDRHTATATRSPLHDHRYTATATRPSHPWPSHVPGHVMSHVPGCVSAPLTMGTYQGPLALRHSRRPLALWHPRPLLPFGPWPLFPRGQHLSSTMPDGGLRLLAALGPWRPPTYGGLWPMGHPWPRQVIRVSLSLGMVAWSNPSWGVAAMAAVAAVAALAG